MIWYILISLFLLLILWILFVPVMLRVDTGRNLYTISLPGVLTTYLVPSNGLFHIRMWLFFVPITMNPFRPGRKKLSAEARSGRKKRKRSGRFGIKGFRRLLKAIHIRTFELDIDTDDFLLNAWLVPAFSAINAQTGSQMQVNFQGDLYLRLDVRTRIGMLLWLFITKR